jgi:hypothetical protein
MVMIKGGKRNEKNNKVVMQCIACSSNWSDRMWTETEDGKYGREIQ